ncbi:MAG: carbohydrate kinase family protein [Anaerolineae bacterium]|jgi:ribokinase|nr:carbohydrate kinase family protein [Anaerolineae bacterium]
MTAKLDVIGLGMNVLDILVRVKEMPTWEHLGHPSRIVVDGGGLAATAVVAAQKLGLRTGFIGTHGNDQMGWIKNQLLAKYGVDLSHAVEMNVPENQICVVYVREDDGERFFSNHPSFWDHYLAPEQLDKAYITSADWLHLDGYHFDAARQAARWMREAGKRVMYDGGRIHEKHIHQDQREILPDVDVLISGSGFLEAITGEQELESAGRKALELGPSIVVQTEGSDGSYTFTKQAYFHQPAMLVDAVDTTGAGDIFHGAYLYALQHRWNLQDSARFATAASALSCFQVGGRNSIPSLKEIETFLAQQVYR